ncbi:tetraspanin-1-like [Arapaima gigas]
MVIMKLEADSPAGVTQHLQSGNLESSLEPHPFSTPAPPFPSNCEHRSSGQQLSVKYLLSYSRCNAEGRHTAQADKMGCFTFVKVMMILFNLLIFLAGAGLLAVGIWVSVDGGSFLKVLGPFSNEATQFVNIGYFCIVIGAVLLLLGFLGCCGAQKESKCLLILFFSIVLIIFIAEIAAAVVALVYSSFVQSLLQAWAKPALQQQYGSNKIITQMWNTTMTELKCCGFSNYTDFSHSNYVKQNQTFPPPCCNGTTPCSKALAQKSNIHVRIDSPLTCPDAKCRFPLIPLQPPSSQGCYNQLLHDLKKNANVVGGVAIGIAAIEMLSMIVSMYLYCHMDKSGQAGALLIAEPHLYYPNGPRCCFCSGFRVTTSPRLDINAFLVPMGLLDYRGAAMFSRTPHCTQHPGGRRSRTRSYGWRRPAS